MQAKKSLGQNFLNKDTIKEKIVSLLNVEKDDLVIEIGPGRGALTKYLSKLETNVICIEIDEDMKEYLTPYESNQLKVIYDDILKFDFSAIKNKNICVIGNLPYYITSPIIEYLIKRIDAKKMVFMVQKEVAQRLCATPGNKEYGYMTVFANYKYEVKYEFTVKKDCFTPSPKVDSAIVSFNKNNNKEINDRFFAFLKKCFAHKRKTLKNNLKEYNWEQIKEILEKHNLSENARAEELPLPVFEEIYNQIK